MRDHTKPTMQNSTVHSIRIATVTTNATGDTNRRLAVSKLERLLLLLLLLIEHTSHRTVLNPHVLIQIPVAQRRANDHHNDESDAAYKQCERHLRCHYDEVPRGSRTSPPPCHRTARRANHQLSIAVMQTNTSRISTTHSKRSLSLSRSLILSTITYSNEAEVGVHLQRPDPARCSQQQPVHRLPAPAASQSFQ